MTDRRICSVFRSVWRKQIELVMVIPPKESMKKGYVMKSVNVFRIAVIHNIPQPQNLTGSAAGTIDPATGVSTCALGNQK